MPVFIFVAALAPRLPGLDGFVTTDEPFNLRQSAAVVDAVLRGDFGATYWHFYPGLTIAWLSGLGVLFQWLWSGAAEPFAQFIQRNVVELLIAARLPHGILGALYAVAVYRFARRLLGGRVALVGALLIAWDPFMLAHTRVTHGDSPVAVFMGLGLLAFLAHLCDPATREHIIRGDLAFSAICGGLAALSKSPGHFIVPFIILLGIGEAGMWYARANRPLFGRRLIQLFVWCAVAGAVFVILWPALWVNPLGTLRRMFEETFDKMEAGHLVFFMGQPTLDPGPWFYPYVIAFRLTPVVWLGLSLAGIALVLVKLSGTRWIHHRGGSIDIWTVGLTGLFVLTILLLAELSPKKQDRYLLVVFPLLDLLAAWGIVRLGEWVANLGTSRLPRFTLGSIFGVWTVLIALHAYPVVTYYPYYLAYFNPLMGGLPRAVETTLVGWGEGMEQVAAYLNMQPGAETAYVAAVPVQTLLPYFRGRGENFYTNDVALRADWVVLYVSQVQRLAPSPEIVRYFRAQRPEHIVELFGVPYAWVYRGPKLITDTPPVGLHVVSNPSGQKMPLQLVGYRIEKQDSSVAVTLGWYAPATVPLDYTVSVRLIGADGRWLAQHDSWPAGGLLPTHQLRPGDYVRDVHVLELGEEGPVHSIQVVVYDAVRNVPLDAPIDLSSTLLD
ncbi:MAG: glycosyltransferase family 39 protein [Anaerolineae bacterium]|nr:glycosyltransferase family 39 protein [Anaerolineae bacterium]MDW8071001.1 glycosyltransferase family 39 protein [Anaerolineae bacterium]